MYLLSLYLQRQNKLLLFEQYVLRDCISQYLVEPREFDETVQCFLQVILAAICQLAKKLYKDHLPNGKCTTLDRNKMGGKPKTSCFAESIFGQLDQLVRTKPNISTLAAESSIMFANNKTADWLNSKTEQERETLIIIYQLCSICI